MKYIIILFLVMLPQNVVSQDYMSNIPSIQPVSIEDILPCGDERLKPLRSIVSKTIEGVPYENFREKERICSFHPDYGLLVRLYFIKTSPEHNEEKYEYQVFWELEKNKVVIVSESASADLGGFNNSK